MTASTITPLPAALADTMPPEVERWSVAGALAFHAQRRPQSPCWAWRDGPPRSYADTLDHATALAHGLAQVGVAPGDTVALLAPNSPGFVEAWFALAVLGAVEVPVNVHHKRTSLVHTLQDSEARVLIVAAGQAAKLLEVTDRLTHLRTLVVDHRPEAGGPLPADVQGALARRFEIHDLAELPVAGDDLPGFASPDPRGLAAVLYTSGTTGPAKGIMLRHAHITVSAWAHVRACELTEQDTYAVVMPLFHSNAQVVQLAPALIAGCAIHVWPEFSASRWLDQMRACGATVTNTLGVMTEFIHAQPPRDDDRDHRLRVVQAIPAPASVGVAFERRFGVRLVGAYGITDVAMISYRMPGQPLVPGGSGTLIDAFEVIVADPETDLPVPTGQVGEILARPRVPFGCSAGYWKRPEATVAMWRNLWMHTGDAGWLDERGELYFHDRLKDAIRVRGENVSSAELEAEIAAHPAVREVATVAVPAEHGEDEILAVVVPSAPGHLDPIELLDFCVERLPYFAVPRYLDLVEELPRTPTEKVRKVELRERGVTATTFDRVAAGYNVRR